MPGQDLSVSYVKPFTAEAAIEFGQAVIQGSAEDACTLAGSANTALFLGFALESAAIGAQVRVQLTGVAKAIAGASVSLGDYLMGEGADGRLKKVALGGSNQYGVAKALRGGSDGDLIPVLICHFIAQGA